MKSTLTWQKNCQDFANLFQNMDKIYMDMEFKRLGTQFYIDLNLFNFRGSFWLVH